ncbi:MAG: protein adenylyltransferase SelO family protein, partial [Verrucomicrobiota bacterium]
MSADAGWRWDHSYVRLPELFFVRTHPVPVREPSLVMLNRALAESLGLDATILARPDAHGIFAGNQIPEGAEPIAQAYAGHQFGHFTGLGDGRAILLGEHLTPDGARFDIQLKGSGRTPFSRGGDGRAALGPMLREYVISEAMHALGTPTTRSLAVASTGELVFRNDELPGAVLTRVAASHIRVGTFQWAAAHEDTAALLALADHTRQRHFPEIADDASRHIAFFRAVMHRQCALVAKWLHVGFI